MSESMADHKPQNQTRLTRAVDQAETLIPDTGMAGGGGVQLRCKITTVVSLRNGST